MYATKRDDNYFFFNMHRGIKTYNKMEKVNITTLFGI